MDPRTSPRPGVGRALAATIACATSALTLSRLGIRAGAGAPAPDALVGAAVLGLGSLAAAVLTAGCAMLLASALAAALGRSWSRTEALAARLLPGLLRRALTVGVGAGITLGLGTGALADEVDVDWQVTVDAPTRALHAPTDAPGPADPSADVPLARGGRPGGPAAASDPSAAPAASATMTAPAPATGPAPDRSPEPSPDPSPDPAPTVTVQAGDSLWAIAERLLPAGATDADVAAAWPRLYDANRDVVGPDPGLIHPGEILTVPTGLSA